MNLASAGFRTQKNLKSRLQFLSVVIVILAALTGLAPGIRAQTAISGVGIMGDSNTDEYRADDNRGGSYGATTLNWLELLVKYRGINAGPWACNPEPRRCGYAYNWSRSAATAASLVASGQHTGLASQIRQGLVSHVAVWIGTNDFNINPAIATYDPIYNGTMSDAALQTKINSVIANITTAVNTVLDAGPIPMVIATIGDPGLSPLVQIAYPNTAGRLRATQAINTVNQAIISLAAAHNVEVFDTNQWVMSTMSGTSFTIYGETINLMAFNNEPHYAALGDMHMGTVLNGLLANKMFIEPMNTVYGQSISQFSDFEIVRNAGISASPPPTPTPAQSSGVPGDANGDTKVDGVDYTAWLLNYHPDSGFTGGVAAGDFNTDTRVDGVDYTIWLLNYNPDGTLTPTPSQTQPTATPRPPSPTPIQPTPTRTPTPTTGAGSAGNALRFSGTGTGDADRVKIPLTPGRPVDIGASDSTVEFWMQANLSDNTTVSCSGGNDAWINGNTILDRDIYGGGDYGDWGISLMNGRIAYGVHNGSTGTTLCGTTNVANGSWHHIALTRNVTSGELRLFVDGALESSKTGPTGNISYRDGRATQYPNSDPYLVIAAEKHDAGSAYPSFSGTLDEIRISTVIRYLSAFSRPVTEFAADNQTAALYHFNDGTGTVLTDSSGASGGPSTGTVKFTSTNPVKPAWIISTAPFSGL